MTEFSASSPEQNPSLLNIARAMAVRDQATNITEIIQTITELGPELPELFSDTQYLKPIANSTHHLTISETEVNLAILTDIAAGTRSGEPYRAAQRTQQESFQSLISAEAEGDEDTVTSALRFSDELQENLSLPTGGPNQAERIRANVQRRLTEAAAVAQKNGVRVEDVFERDDLYRELIRNKWFSAADCASALTGFINGISDSGFYDVLNPIAMSIETMEKKAEAEDGDTTLSVDETMEIIAKLGELLQTDEMFKKRVEQTIVLAKVALSRVLARRLENIWGDTAVITLPADLQSVVGYSQFHQKWPDLAKGDDENGLEEYVAAMGGWIGAASILAIRTLNLTGHYI